MSHHGAQHAAGARKPPNLDYRLAHLADHLAAGPLGELGVRVELRGQAVQLTGTVPSAQYRDDICRMAGEELPGVPVHCDILVAESSSPDHAEELA